MSVAMNTWDRYMSSAEEAYRSGQSVEAQKYWLLAVKEAEEAGDHRRISITLDRLAEAVKQLGNYDNAEMVLKMALELQEEMYGPDHFGVIGTLNNLVEVLHTQGKYDEALPIVHRMVNTYRATFGDEHPGLASIACNMANVYHEAGRSEAEDFYKLSIAIKTKMFGYKHDEVVSLVSKYAEFLASMGREVEAETLQTESKGSVSGVWTTVAAKMNESSEKPSLEKGLTKIRRRTHT